MSARMEGEDIAEKLSEMLKVLASPIRLRILALCLDGERTSRELREFLGLSKPLLIMHLRKLVDAGFLEFRAELDETRMIVRKHYRTRNLELCVGTKVLREIAEHMEQGRKEG